jgi:hypothetical protein
MIKSLKPGKNVSLRLALPVEYGCFWYAVSVMYFSITTTPHNNATPRRQPSSYLLPQESQISPKSTFIAESIPKNYRAAHNTTHIFQNMDEKNTIQ